MNSASATASVLHEGRIAGTFHHPNIVQVFACRVVQNELFLILQYVPDGSLQDCVLKNGPLEWSDACRYVADVAEGLV